VEAYNSDTDRHPEILGGRLSGAPKGTGALDSDVDGVRSGMKRRPMHFGLTSKFLNSNCTSYFLSFNYILP